MAGEPVTGRNILRASWATNVVFAVTATPLALGAKGWEPVAVGAALLLFAVSLVVWVWAFAIAVGRSARGDDIAVASLFFLAGRAAPRTVKVQLFSSLGVCLVLTALFTSSDPFVVLVPMLPLGWCGLWGARHGVFPPRADRAGTDPEVGRTPVRPARAGRSGAGGRGTTRARSGSEGRSTRGRGGE